VSSGHLGNPGVNVWHGSSPDRPVTRIFPR
jgi:hypothetical protein